MNAWPVERWGRLVAGASILAFTALAVLHHPYWLLAVAAGAVNLVLSALTDRCPVRALLLKLGARECDTSLETGPAASRAGVLVERSLS
ncbi:MAG: DUF2892 domain-containing protein [Planctomycetes bacterium]|nr:DUF2892 domain-containing protein [Planctomycetota bacterium]